MSELAIRMGRLWVNNLGVYSDNIGTRTNYSLGLEPEFFSSEKDVTDLVSVLEAEQINSAYPKQPVQVYTKEEVEEMLDEGQLYRTEP